MEEDKDLQKHKQIVLIEEFTNVLYERLYETLEKFFIEMKNNKIETNIQVSSYYNAGIKFINGLVLFMELAGVKTTEFIEFEKIQESKEIVNLEDRYGNRPEV